MSLYFKGLQTDYKLISDIQNMGFNMLVECLERLSDECPGFRGETRVGDQIAKVGHFLL